MCVRIDQALTYGAPLFGRYDMSTMLTYDDIGVIGRPHGRYLKYKLNKLGYRSPEPRADRERIVTIGASETFGLFESEGKEYPRQLERELNARAGSDRYQVQNVAFAGQSLNAAGGRVPQIADEIQPELALVYPSFLPYINPPADGREPVDWVKQDSSFQSRLWPKLWNLMDTLPPFVNDLRFEYHIWKTVRNRPVRQQVPEANVSRFHEDLVNLLDKLQENNIRCVLVTHATYFGDSVDPDERPRLIAWRRMEPTLAESGFLDFEKRMNAVIRQEAAARQIKLIDAEARMNQHEFFADWVHFTDTGAAHMARLLATEIAPSGTLDPEIAANETSVQN